ncbi:MAG: hypothetical protein JST54_29235 [Deltaproteobacteria bacterium]|nr:hypothetical protein [Deltaproteobacteria bacterium]
MAVGLLALAACGSSSSSSGNSGSTGGGSTGGCEKETDQAYCARLAKNCDVFTGFDNCGSGRSVNCGQCTASQTCVDNVCQSESGSSSSSSTSSSSSSGSSSSSSASSSSSSSTGTSSSSGSTGTSSSSGSTGTTSSGSSSGSSGSSGSSCPAAGCPTHGTFVSGSFNINSNLTTVNGTPYTHAFDGVVAENVSFLASFDVGTITQMPGGGPSFPNGLSISGSNAQVAFTGDSSGTLSNNVVPNLTGGTIYFTLTAGFSGSSTGNADIEVLGVDNSGSVFTMEVSCTPTNLGLDTSGYPVLANFTCAPSSGNMILRRFQGPGTSSMTDFASGPSTGDFATDAGT